jgi:prepilin-type N-terminal cleavage/methylation domain-containing protein
MLMRSTSNEDGFTLMELSMVSLILTIVLVIVTSFLISAQATITRSTARAVNDAAAQQASGLLDSNLRFATYWTISGSSLYVYVAPPSPQPVCSLWTVDTTNKLLTRQTAASQPAAVIARGVTGTTPFTANSGYTGLITVALNLKAPGTIGSDPAGASLNETVVAQNWFPPAAPIPPQACNLP